MGHEMVEVAAGRRARVIRAPHAAKKAREISGVRGVAVHVERVLARLYASAG